MPATIIRPELFPACHASLHAPTRKERTEAREQVLAIAEAGADSHVKLRRLVAATASAFAAERLGVQLMWDEGAGAFRRESRPRIRIRGTAEVIPLPCRA